MSATVADHMLERLSQWGVRRIYGFPGDGINGFLGAFERAGDRLEFIQVRHEEMAAFMACAHAKFTGEVGVCMATSGPGRDSPAQRPLRREARPSAGGRDRRPAGARGARRQLPAGGRPARRCSRTSRTSTCRSRCVPAQVAPSDRPRLAHRARRAHGDVRDRAQRPRRRWRRSRRRRASTARSTRASATRARAIVPHEADLRARGRRAQRRARGGDAGRRRARCSATDEVIEVAELLGAGVAKALLGKAAVPDDLPFVTGAIGLLGTKPELGDDERAATRC